MSGGAVMNMRVPGHGLQREGRAFAFNDGSAPARETYRYTGETEGMGVCSCGAHSPVLSSTAARRRWHVAHKVEMREKWGNL